MGGSEVGREASVASIPYQRPHQTQYCVFVGYQGGIQSCRGAHEVDEAPCEWVLVAREASEQWSLEAFDSSLFEEHLSGKFEEELAEFVGEATHEG
jgi:hypothetical protein